MGKDHMQSLQDYSTYRNAKNYMFAPSPSVTPQIGTLQTPVQTHMEGSNEDFEGMLPPAAIDTMLPPAAIDTETFGFEEAPHTRSPALSASAAPWSPQLGCISKSPPLSAAAAPWTPPTQTLTSSASKSPSLSPE